MQYVKVFLLLLKNTFEGITYTNKTLLQVILFLEKLTKGFYLTVVCKVKTNYRIKKCF